MNQIVANLKGRQKSRVAELKNCDIVFTMLPDAKSTFDVIFSEKGLLKYLSKGSLIVNSGTIGISESINIMNKLDGYCDFVDAPVSGGTLGAEKGNLTFMIGGKYSSLERIKDLLNAMGKHIFFLGDVGKGQAAKICNNMLLAINMCGASEAFALAKRLDLDINKFNKLINQSSGRSWVTECNNTVPGIDSESPSSKNYCGGFSSRLLLKDIRLALDASEEQNLTLNSLKTAESEYSQMIDKFKESEIKDMGFIFQHINNLKNKP